MDGAETVPVQGFYAPGSQLTGLWSSRVKRFPPPLPHQPWQCVSSSSENPVQTLPARRSDFLAIFSLGTTKPLKDLYLTRLAVSWIDA